MSEREDKVLKMILDSTKECIEILERLNNSQEKAVEKINQIIKGGKE